MGYEQDRLKAQLVKQRAKGRETRKAKKDDPDAFAAKQAARADGAKRKREEKARKREEARYFSRLLRLLFASV